MITACLYKVIVKGEEKACVAFMGSMPKSDHITILDRGGTKEDHFIVFEGKCLYSLDHQIKEYPVNANIPDGFEEAYRYGEQFTDASMQKKAEGFEVEVLCNSLDAEKIEEIFEYSYGEVEGHIGRFQHYKKGILIEDYCPERLEIYLTEPEEDYEE